MARYDIETFMSELKAFLLANLNTQIAVLNAEKDDGFDLKEVDPKAYAFQTLDGFDASFDPIVFLGIREISSKTAGPAVGKTYQVEVDIIMNALENEQDDFKQILRYHRVLEDLFANNWMRIGQATNLKIESLVPTALVQNATPQRVVGLTVSLTFI